METFPQIITVENQEQGLDVAKNVLYKNVDDQTLLFLSGGSTPKDLYSALAKEKKLAVKAVGMVDERKDKSNYKMIKSTELIEYLDGLKIKFYPIISAASYDRNIRKIIDSSKNKVAIMGIGADGHTAGLPASPKLQRGEPAGIQNSSIRQAQDKIQNYVTQINNFPIEPRERITLTFNAMSKMDLLIVLAFGSAKQNALREMFKEGPIEEIPARFYTRPDIAKKTILITDQKI